MARTLDEIQVALKQATERYEQARTRESQTRSEATSALNHLNSVQREFDEAVAALKKTSPRESDWQERARRAGQIPVER